MTETTFDLYGEGTCTIEELLDVAAHNLVPILKSMNHTWRNNIIPDEAEIRTVLDSLYQDIKESIAYSEENDEDMIPEWVGTGGITLLPIFDEYGQFEDIRIVYEVGSRYQVAKVKKCSFTN